MSSLLNFLVLQNTILNQILEESKKDVCSDTTYEITIVLGNEACDLDSTVSALLWSYYLQSQTNDKSKLYIPILTIPRKELKLRKEIVHLLQQIDKSLIQNLFFIDIIPKIISYLSCDDDENNKTEQEEKEEKKQSSFNYHTNANLKLNVHLVDHNNLSITLEPLLGQYVNFIIDHHKDEVNYLKNCNGNNRNISVAASNVSNIINHILLINKNYDISQLGKEFGALITATIVLDTGAFNEKLKKTTKVDTDVYKLFEQYNLINDHKIWFDQLLNMRIDVNGFDFGDLLVKDFKIFRENSIVFGIPSLGVPLQNIIESENETLFDSIDSFQNEKKLDIITAMTIYCDKLNDNQLKRQLALFTGNEVLFNSVSNALETKENKQYLKLQPIQIQKYNHLKLNNRKPIYFQWWSMDLSISRKTLVPLLRKILSKL